ILEEAAKYIRDLIKPGTFSQKTLRRIKDFIGSKDMLEYHADLVQRLDAAIQDLQLDYVCAIHKKVNYLLDYAQLAMVTKGADIREDSIYVDPSKVEEYDDTEIRGKTKKIKKMLFNGCVAVAVRKVQASDKTQAERQATILNKLSVCRNIENFQGLMRKNEEVYVVTEWAANYDLERHLRSDVEISWAQKLKFAEGIAAALTFCHEADIFHHDVKSANVLLDEHLNVKLSNFDMARFSNEATTSLSDQMKSIRWTAPEKLNITYVPYSKQMDVYR
ncbi:10002_t:CDS:2, partial [Ambispora gerdemannii]